MTTRQDQKMAFGPITYCRESLKTPNRKIKVDSPTCLKTLLKKTQEIFDQNKDKLKSDLCYRLLQQRPVLDQDNP
jgi:hypothetical protein